MKGTGHFLEPRERNETVEVLRIFRREKSAWRCERKREIPTGNGFNENKSLNEREPEMTIGFEREIEIITSKMRLGCHRRTALHN